MIHWPDWGCSAGKIVWYLVQHRLKAFHCLGHDVLAEIEVRCAQNQTKHKYGGEDSGQAYAGRTHYGDFGVGAEANLIASEAATAMATGIVMCTMNGMK